MSLNDRSHVPSSDRLQTRSAPSFPRVEVQIPTDLDAVDAGSCLAPWKRDFKLRSKSKAGSFSYLVLDRVDGGSTPALLDHYLSILQLDLPSRIVYAKRMAGPTRIRSHCLTRLT
jgi:hypothetical protein